MKGINLKRQPPYISILAERPYSIRAIFHDVFRNLLAIMGLVLSWRLKTLRSKVSNGSHYNLLFLRS